MKSSAKSGIKGKLNEVRHKPEEKLGTLMNDPTLEGKDENKVGRFQRKIRQADNDIQKDQAGCSPLTVKKVPSSSSSLSSCSSRAVSPADHRQSLPLPVPREPSIQPFRHRM